ncbi:MAG TPA: hypothetical protein VJO32_04705, partial [Ktedonobacteraceae bacterium]|nr:hypothetical protein [Ktedonobacteraceae bacterium]
IRRGGGGVEMGGDACVAPRTPLIHEGLAWRKARATQASPPIPAPLPPLRTTWRAGRPAGAQAIF